MRILWIKTELLHPVDKGGRIRTYQMLRAMKREHEITYVALDDGTATERSVAQAAEYCHRLVRVPFTNPSANRASLLIAVARNVFSTLPFAIEKYRCPALSKTIRECLDAADVLVCDFLAPSINVAVVAKPLCVLFQHNVESVIWQRHASVSKGYLKRLFMAEQWRRMERFEREECRRFSHVIAVSDTDSQVFAERFGTASVSHVTTGVDLEYFSPRMPAPVGCRVIVFVGSMDWMPNEDGVTWFLSEIFGQVLSASPGCRFVIVGRNPTVAIRRIARAHPNVEVTGTVDDVRPYLEAAAVCVVPLRIGGGTRLKIYEAMAMGVPVVTTTIGAEGLPLVSGEHALIRDEPGAFAGAVSSLIGNPGLGDQLAAAALGLVRAHCGWDSVARQFVQQCTAAAAREDPITTGSVST